MRGVGDTSSAQYFMKVVNNINEKLLNMFYQWLHLWDNSILHPAPSSELLLLTVYIHLGNQVSQRPSFLE